jgi:hypothetical protein
MRNFQLGQHEQLVSDLLGVLTGLAAGRKYGVFSNGSHQYRVDSAGLFYRDILTYTERVIAKTISEEEASNLVAILLLLSKKHVVVLNYLYRHDFFHSLVYESVTDDFDLSAFFYIDEYVKRLEKNLPKVNTENSAFIASKYFYIHPDEDEHGIFTGSYFHEGCEKASSQYKEKLLTHGIQFEGNSIFFQNQVYFKSFNKLLLSSVGATGEYNEFNWIAYKNASYVKKMWSVYKCLQNIGDSLIFCRDRDDGHNNLFISILLIEMQFHQDKQTFYQVDKFCNDLMSVLGEQCGQYPALIQSIKEVQFTLSSPFKNLCVAPAALQGVFSETYEKMNVLSQEDHQIAVNMMLSFIYKNKWNIEHFKGKGSGEYFCSFMSVLSVYYSCRFKDYTWSKQPTVESYSILRGCDDENIARTAFKLTNKKHTGRKLSNILASVEMLQACSKGGICSISIKDFIDRAKQYFELNIRVNFHQHFNMCTPIAAVSREDSGGEKQEKLTHCLGYFFRLDQAMSFDAALYLPDILVNIYTKLLEVIFDENKTKQTRINAIFCLVFLHGSNPFLINERGGAFQVDVILLLLLEAIGEKPIRKNFLNITEIFLLLCFSQDDKASWDKPYLLYQAACQGETNSLFHPIDKSVFYLLKTLPSAEAFENTWSNYAASRLLIIFKMAVYIEKTDVEFYAMTSLLVCDLMAFFEKNNESVWINSLREKKTLSLNELIYFVVNGCVASVSTLPELEQLWIDVASSMPFSENQYALLGEILWLYQDKITRFLDVDLGAYQFFKNFRSESLGIFDDKENSCFFKGLHGNCASLFTQSALQNVSSPTAASGGHSSKK